MNKRLKFALAASCLVAGSNVVAAPWVDTSDEYLRASITALADGNIIKRPVNTYPLMWKGIAQDLRETNEASVPEHLQFAWSHVKHALTQAQKEKKVAVKLAASSDEDGFQSFGERHDAKGRLSVSSELMTDNLAVGLTVNVRGDSPDDRTLTLDGSYVSYSIGNWVISADQVSSWWGPGKDSALGLSNNARAFPAVRLTRHSAEPFDWPVLDWFGPWTFTTYIGQQESSNALPDILLWGARVGIRPHPKLEIGFTRTAQWGGQGRSKDFSDLWNVIKGSDNAGEIDPDAEPGNQLAGIDARFSHTISGIPVGAYLEVIGEDEAGGLPSHTMHLVGVDMAFGDADSHYQAFAEFSDTYVDCGFNGTAGNCAYEHHLFPEGYRRYGRSMGSTYDSDAQVFVLGVQNFTASGFGWFSKVKLMKLNKDNSNNESFVNPVAAVGEDRVQFDAGVQFPLFKGLAKVSGYIYQADRDEGGNKTDGLIRASWEYRL